MARIRWPIPAKSILTTGVRLGARRAVRPAGSSPASGRNGDGSLAESTDEVRRASRRAVEGAHLEPTGLRTDVRAREEVEILAARVERGRDGVRHAVGDLRRLSVGDRVDEDRAQVAVEALRVRDPARVGRPRRVRASGRDRRTCRRRSWSPCPSRRRATTGSDGCPRTRGACRPATTRARRRTPATAAARRAASRRRL